MGSPSPSDRGLAPRSERHAAADIADELRLVIAERRDKTYALERAIETVRAPRLSGSLREVAAKLPVAASVEVATIRIADDHDRFHLVAAAGCPPHEVRTRAFEPLAADLVERMLASGALATHASALGIQWVHVVWIAAGAPIGTLLVGTRTERRPTRADLDVVTNTAAALGAKLTAIDRDEALLRGCSLELARAVAPERPVAFADEAVAALRPRERQILELYGDGLRTEEIAELLFISVHTVRTQVKSAMRRLGVHDRAEAARRVRTEQMLQLL